MWNTNLVVSQKIFDTTKFDAWVYYMPIHNGHVSLDNVSKIFMKGSGTNN